MTQLRELVILSLEPWDEVKRRNQLLVEALIRDLPDLRVLFAEPPIAALRNIADARPSVRQIESLPGVTVLRTVQWTPQRFSPWVPPFSGRSIARAARDLGFGRPVLWINNHSLARFALGTGWPVVYDITDDWLLADVSTTKRRRAERDDSLLMHGADTVVVCSPALAATRGKIREVMLIPNGVDVARFSTPQRRPDDLGPEPVAAYVGTLHEDRLDVRLCCDIADQLPNVHFTYVGPDCLGTGSRDALTQRSNVQLLGSRPYAVVPAYLQHADVIVIPHVVSPFTESLDPIKARECLAVGTPTVATPVAGFRDLGPPIHVVPPEGFAAGIREALKEPRHTAAPPNIWTWTDAAREFRAVLEKTLR